MWNWHRSLFLLFVAQALAGCAIAPHGAPAIDTRYRAQGQDSRVQYLILHYTDNPFEPALRILRQQEVSAHYLVSDNDDPPVAYFSPSWTAFQADGGRDFSVIVDAVSVGSWTMGVARK